MKRTSLDQFKKMPWKNGGGITHEYQVFPEGKSVDSDDFQWRISVAEVLGSGDFSLFPNRKRWLALWKGPEVEISDQVHKSEFILDKSPKNFSGDDRLSYRQILTKDHLLETSWDLGIIYHPQKVNCLMHRGELNRDEYFVCHTDHEYFFIMGQNPEIIELSKNETFDLKNQSSVEFYQLCLTFI